MWARGRGPPQRPRSSPSPPCPRGTRPSSGRQSRGRGAGRSHANATALLVPGVKGRVSCRSAGWRVAGGGRSLETGSIRGAVAPLAAGADGRVCHTAIGSVVMKSLGLFAGAGEALAGGRPRPHVQNDRLRHMLIGYARALKIDGSQVAGPVARHPAGRWHRRRGQLVPRRLRLRHTRRPAGTRQLPAHPAEGRRARRLEARPPGPEPRPSRSPGRRCGRRRHRQTRQRVPVLPGVKSVSRPLRPAPSSCSSNLNSGLFENFGKMRFSTA